MLNLGENELTELPNHLCACTSLAKLYIDNNNILAVSQDISTLTTLRELNLRSNALQILPRQITTLTNLKLCDINSNLFHDPFLNEEHTVPELFDFLSTHEFVIHENVVLDKQERREVSLKQTANKQAASFNPQPIKNVPQVYAKKTLVRVSQSHEYVYARLVKPEATSVTHEDAYVYDNQKGITLWIGQACSKQKADKARVLAGLMAEEKFMDIKRIDHTIKDQTMSDDLLLELDCKAFSTASYDEEHEFEQFNASLHFFSFDMEHNTVSDTTGVLLTTTLLHSSETFVLDTGIDLFVWAGKNSEQQEKDIAWLHADSLLSETNRQPDQIFFVNEGAETPLFREYFAETAASDSLTHPPRRLQETEAARRSVTPLIDRSPSPRVANSTGNIPALYPRKSASPMPPPKSPRKEKNISVDFQKEDIAVISVMAPAYDQMEEVMKRKKEHEESLKRQEAEVQRLKEEKRRLEEDQQRRREEAEKQRAEEKRRREEEKRRREEEQQRKNEELQRKKKEAREQAEERKKEMQERLEAAKVEKERIAAERKKKMEEQRKKEEDKIRRVEEMRRKREEERRQREEERMKAEEELRKLEEERRREEEEVERRKKEKEEAQRAAEKVRQEEERRAKEEADELRRIEEERRREEEEERRKTAKKDGEEEKKEVVKPNEHVNGVEKATGKESGKKETAKEKEMRKKAERERKRKEEEEKKKREKEEKERKKAEEEEKKRRKAEAKKREEERQRLEAQIKKRKEEDEARRVEEERLRKEEERRMKEEEEQRQEEERRLLEEQQKIEEQIRQEEENLRLEAQRIEEETRRREQQIQEEEEREKERQKEAERQAKEARDAAARLEQQRRDAEKEEEECRKRLEEQQKEEERIVAHKLEEELKRLEESKKAIEEEKRQLEQVKQHIKQQLEQEVPTNKDAANTRMANIFDTKTTLMGGKRRPTKQHRLMPSANVFKSQLNLKLEEDTTSNKFQLTEQVVSNKRAELKTFEINPDINPVELPRLFQIKGKRRPFVKQVELTWESLNSGDSFLYDPGKGTTALYLWFGKTTNRMEKGKTLDIAKQIKDKERFNVKYINVEEGKEPAEFWEGLHGPPTRPLRSDVDGGDDVEAEQSIKRYITLFKCEYNRARDQVTMTRAVPEGSPLMKDILDNKYCYILDCYTEIFVWLGKQELAYSKNKITKYAENMWKERRAEMWLAPFYKEFSTVEQVMFKERFADWNTVPIGAKAGPAPQIQKGPGLGNAINFDEMLAPCPEKKEIYIDEADGKIQVYRIDNFKKIEIPQEDYGVFYEGESYIVLYTYQKWNHDMHLLYFWQGRNCPVLDKGACARLTVDFHQRLKAEAKQMRVVQNTETRHFLKVFAKNLVFRNAKYVSEKEYDVTRPVMYDIRGEVETYVKAIEVELNPNKLFSYGVFLLLTRDVAYIWKGRFALDIHMEYAMAVLERPTMKRAEVCTVEEGAEPDAFVRAIGGRCETPQPSRRYLDRFYEFSGATGMLRFEEHPHFFQDNLPAKGSVLLDTADAFYLWVSRQCTPIERKLALETCIDFVKRGADDQLRARKVLVVNDKREPYVFTNHFQSWEATKGQVCSVSDNIDDAVAEFNKYFIKYSYDDLVHKRFPKGLDESVLETYLSDEEFLTVFGMTFPEFQSLPVWKRDNLKKSKKLY